MGLNVNYVIVDKTLTKIKSIFGDISKEKQESLTDDVLDFLEKMEKKYKTMNIEDHAREILKQKGYFTDNLWHIDDVKAKAQEMSQIPVNELSDEDCYEVLRNVFKSDYFYEQMWVSIQEELRLKYEE